MRAADLAELHRKYTPAEILRELRISFLMRDRRWYDDEQLFVRATQLYFCVNEGKEDKAAELLSIYQQTGTVPLEIARPLIADAQR